MTGTGQHIQQFHFGPPEAPLFGAFHEALSVSATAPAVLLCNPFGVEAIRAHRIFRILAEKFAAIGSPVLRFDYRGSGDSAGESSAFTLAGAAEDIVAAHQELLDRSGAARVLWLGLRLGAGIALKAAAQRPKNLRSMILWQPVADGGAYRRELETAHIAELARIFDQSEKAVRAARPVAALSGEALGMPLSPQLQAELAELSVAGISARPARSVAVISGAPEQALRAHLEALGSRTQFSDDAQAEEWNSDAALNAFVVPRTTLERIVETAGVLR